LQTFGFYEFLPLSKDAIFLRNDTATDVGVEPDVMAARNSGERNNQASFM
jgi:hypothetical protein